MDLKQKKRRIEKQTNRRAGIQMKAVERESVDLETNI